MIKARGTDPFCFIFNVLRRKKSQETSGEAQDPFVPDPKGVVVRRSNNVRVQSVPFHLEGTHCRKLQIEGRRGRKERGRKTELPVQAQKEYDGFLPSRISQTCTYESTEEVAKT